MTEDDKQTTNRRRHRKIERKRDRQTKGPRLMGRETDEQMDRRKDQQIN